MQFLRNLRPALPFALLFLLLATEPTAQLNGQSVQRNKKPAFTANSVLATGKWFKIGTTQNGLHRIDYATLRTLGLNPDQLDPRNLKIFGRGGGMVPQSNSAYRPDDLVEIPVTVQGETDGKFNPGDFLVFYGESQIQRYTYDASTGMYSFQPNLYCDTTYYFLTADGAAGKRVQQAAALSGEDAIVDTYQHLYFHNNEKSNLIKSGKVWVGEEFDRITQQQFNVSIPNLVPGKPVRFRSSVTARSFVTSQFQIKLNDAPLLDQVCSLIQPGYEQPHTCGLVVSETTFTPPGANFTLSYNYNKPGSGSIGWLDFFEVQGEAQLSNTNGNFIFMDATNTGAGKKTKYQIGSSRNLTIWDVTNPLLPVQIPGALSSGTFSFVQATDSLKTFLVFDGSNYLQVTNAGPLANQNLHALPIPDGFIISHPDFLSEAKRLAAHHLTHDSLKIAVVNVQEIYNEFAGGSPDLCAVRDFLRMFYLKAPTPADRPKYVALFGRASYDYKYRQKPNSNFIPTFESWESFTPTGSYCSDDFFGFLDDNEGNWDLGTNVNEVLDIGIGRLPATNITEATELVNKVIAYNTAVAFGPWRNKLVFVADDEDNNTHQTQADALANNLLTSYPELNIEKIYLDAYKKESTAGGARYPDAQKAINQAIQNGCLIFNYTGHGGEVGLTAERVLGIDDINRWTNAVSGGQVKLPLFVTATCEFSRFDDPARQAAGELVLLSPTGGAIALFTTVRLVFSGQNEILNRKFYENAGLDSASRNSIQRLGDIARKTKNAYTLPDANTRNFTLLGDPFLGIAYPVQKVKTTLINGKPAVNFNDTLKALKKVDVSGVVTDRSGNVLSSYNGVVYPVVYDKFTTYYTNGNTPSTSSPMPFVMQNNVLYRGKASVTNGNFSFSFVVPKDIAYEYGSGKISYYAGNDQTDAAGMDNRILIGGTSDSSASDKKGPEIRLFLNDEKFVNGGTTHESPTLVAKLFDENGINTTGRGIGRDLTAVIDNKTTQSIVLNDNYQATLNSYQSGSVEYMLNNLSAGKHQLRFRAFDVFNNMSEATLDFEVVNSSNPAISHLLNYPNPFNRHTTFHFDHNLGGQPFEVMIQVFTLNGKLIRTLQASSTGSGTHFDQLTWDGRDDYGDRLANGVYLYRCRIKPNEGKVVDKTEKLVILN